MDIILALLVFIIVLCGGLLLDAMRQQSQRKKSLRARLSNQGSMGMDDEMLPELISGELSPFAKMLSGLLRILGVDVAERVTALELRFARAGINSKNGPVYYLFFQRVICIFITLFGIVILIRAHGSLINYVLGTIVTVIGLFGPYLYLQNKIDNREKLLLRSFPDALDLLLICVESGLALDAALAKVCSELGRAHPTITSELNRTRLELAILNDRPRALMNLGERTGMIAFRSLVVALIQSERFGTALTDTLRVLSEDFRLQRLMKAEEKAARLPVILTVPLILLLMPAFFIIILGPAIIGFMHQGGPVAGNK